MNKLILLLILFFSENLANGQTVPSIVWQKSLGGSSDDFPLCVEQISGNEFVIAGYSSSPDYDVTGNHGNTDYWIVKTDSNGNILAQKSYGGTEGEAAYDISMTTDSGFIVAGGSYSNDGDVTGNHGDEDFWIVRLNASGNIIWQKSLGGSLRDEAYAVEQTDDSGFITAGYNWSGDGNVTGFHGEHDAWIVKLNQNGSLVWQRSLGGSAGEVAKAVQQISDGAYIVSGYTDSNDGDVSGNHGSSDCWIVKLDPDGNIIWQKALGGSNDDRANDIHETSDGGFIVVGYSNSNDGQVSGNNGDYDFWVLKLDENGNIVWQKSLGGSGVDAAYNVQEIENQNYIVAGYSGSNDGDVSGNHGAEDFWIIRLDANGNLLWQKSLGGSVQDEGYSIVRKGNGGYLATGWSYSNDGDVSGNHGNSDYWLVSLESDFVTGINNVTAEYDLSIFPNPASDFVAIYYEQPVRPCTSLSITNIHGHNLLEQQISVNTSKQNFDFSNWQRGIYFVKVKYGNICTVHKLILE